MRLEFEPNSSALPFVENEVVSQDVSSEVERMLREGVRAAQEGKRAEARQLLLRVTEANADSENAWLWLASISEYPEELLVFLNHVLRINPQNERALEWHKATNSLLAKTLVQRGIDATNDKRPEFARQCFEQALEHESENEMAWLWMAAVADSDDEKAAYFEKVLSINAENETARASLKSIQSQKTQKIFQNALAAAFDGRHADALDMVEEVLSHDDELEDAWVLKSHLAGSFEERAECFLKLRVLNPENEMAKVNLASWRMLAELLAELPKAEETSVAVAAVEIVEAVESAEVSFEETAEEATAETIQTADEFAAVEFVTVDETETPAEAFVEEVSAVEEALAVEEVSAAGEEVEEVSAAEVEEAYFAESEEENEAYFESPDAPTQELSLAPAETESFAAEEQTAAVEEPTAAETEENSYEEFHSEEVQFESEENGGEVLEFSAPAENLKDELEAEEAEMNWAFSDSQESKDAEDYFQDYEESDDIHKTQQANYDLEDFALNSAAEETESLEMAADVEMSAKTSAETNVEMSAEMVGQMPEEEAAEEWRDTSPGVFVDYSTEAATENSYDAPTAQLTAPETAVGEMLTEVDAEEEISAAAVVFEDDYSWEPAEEQVEEAFEEQAAEESQMSFAETLQPATEEKTMPRAETILCPFCDASNEKQAFSCGACQTILTLSDLEMLLASQAFNEEKLRQSIESLERENESYGLSAEQMRNLGIGHVNLKNFRQGFLYLQEAVRMNPSNVLLDAQVNALAIRLSEMEEQQSVHDSMPKNRKILVVDDSPTVRKLISGKLEKCGHEVVCAVDGVDALEKINELLPDLVLLDITMPRMDGYQVCKLIRSNETTKDVPVVMISGKDGFFDKVRGRMAGTSGYITKPFGPETLMKTVETYLN